MRMTVDVPGPLVRRAREVAVEHHLTLSELVSQALRAEVKRLSSPTQPREFRFTTVAGHGLCQSVLPQSLRDRAHDLPS